MQGLRGMGSSPAEPSSEGNFAASNLNPPTPATIAREPFPCQELRQYDLSVDSSEDDDSASERSAELASQASSRHGLFGKDEDGRKPRRYAQGKYLMPDDKVEQDRLTPSLALNPQQPSKSRPAHQRTSPRPRPRNRHGYLGHRLRTLSSNNPSPRNQPNPQHPLLHPTKPHPPHPRFRLPLHLDLHLHLPTKIQPNPRPPPSLLSRNCASPLQPRFYSLSAGWMARDAGYGFPVLCARCEFKGE